MKLAKTIIHRLGRRYISEICSRENEQQTFTRHNERSIEYRFVFEQLTGLIPVARTVLDVGTGTTALPAMVRTCGFLVTAMDNVRDYWPEAMVNRHWSVVDEDILSPNALGQFDVIMCISVLEHIKEHARAVRNMLSHLAPGGRFILTCPYNEREYCGNVYDQPESSYGRGNPYVCQSYSRVELDGWLRDSGARVLTQEYWQFFDGRLWTFGAAVPPRRTSAEEAHQHTCLLIGRD